MKRHIVFSFLLIIMYGITYAQEVKRTDQPWQLDVSAGIQSFYAPYHNLKWNRSEFITAAGLGKPLGTKQLFAVTLQFGYARNNYQGDAVYLQLLGQYTPVIINRIEAGIGLGVGYRLGLYASKNFKWNGTDWVKGKAFKGMYQVPLQLSLGYRSFKYQSYEIRPYLAYQLQALFGYSPDLSPLPVSAYLLGFKIQKH